MKISDKIVELLALAKPRAYSREDLDQNGKDVSITIFKIGDYFQVAVDKWNLDTFGDPKHESTFIAPYDTEGYTLLESLNEAIQIASGCPEIPSPDIIVKNGRKFKLVPVEE